MLKRVITGALLAMIMMLGVNASAADLPKQKICPLMIEEEIDLEDFEIVVYKGVKILMCCSTCKKMWAQNPDYYAVVSVKEAPSAQGGSIQGNQAHEAALLPGVHRHARASQEPFDGI